MKGCGHVHRPIRTEDDADKLLALHGISQKIVDKVKEIIRTGGLERLKHMKERPDLKAINELMKVRWLLPFAASPYTKCAPSLWFSLQVWGIGAAKAEELYHRGATDLPTLRQLVKEGKIKLQPRQELGLQYAEDFQQRIPRQAPSLPLSGVCCHLFPCFAGTELKSQKLLPLCAKLLKVFYRVVSPWPAAPTVGALPSLYLPARLFALHGFPYFQFVICFSNLFPLPGGRCHQGTLIFSLHTPLGPAQSLKVSNTPLSMVKLLMPIRAPCICRAGGGAVQTRLPPWHLSDGQVQGLL